jgi:hypothetical protein
VTDAEFLDDRHGERRDLLRARWRRSVERKRAETP